MAIGIQNLIRAWNGVDDLSDLSLDAEMARLRTARTVADFAEIVDRLNSRGEFGELVSEGFGKGWREAWTAVQLAPFIDATHLQLSEECAAEDFYVRRENQGWQGFQVTIALQKDRPLAAEIRAARHEESGPKPVGQTEMDRQSDGALPALIKALKKKRGHERLAIYWNTGWLVQPHKFVPILRAATEQFRQSYEEAWIVGKHSSAIRVAPDFHVIGPIQDAPTADSSAFDELFGSGALSATTKAKG